MDSYQNTFEKVNSTTEQNQKSSCKSFFPYGIATIIILYFAASVIMVMVGSFMLTRSQLGDSLSDFTETTCFLTERQVITVNGDSFFNFYKYIPVWGNLYHTISYSAIIDVYSFYDSQRNAEHAYDLYPLIKLIRGLFIIILPILIFFFPMFLKFIITILPSCFFIFIK